MIERLENLQKAIQEQIYDSVFIRIAEDEQRVFVRIVGGTMTYETTFTFDEVMKAPYQLLTEKVLNDYERTLIKCYFRYRR